MDNVWFNFLISLSCCGAGLVSGWIMHAMHNAVAPGQRRPADMDDFDASSAISNDGEVEIDFPKERAQMLIEIAERLKSYAGGIAADVETHQSTMEAVNDALHQSDEMSSVEVATAIQQLLNANERMQSQLEKAQDQIHSQSLQIESAKRRAETDPLTRVPNRGALDMYLHQRHQVADKSTTALAMLDVDHFKNFNDCYGHAAGDEVLRVVAGILHARLAHLGTVARFGGEEFAMVLDRCSIEEASQHVEAARIAVGQREIHCQGERLKVTASVGVASVKPGESLEDWLHRADAGLYQSKNAGRDCGHWMEDRTPHLIEYVEDWKPTSVSDSLASEEQSNPIRRPSKKSASDDAKMVEGAAGPFSGLTDRGALSKEFSGLRERGPSGLALSVMAIRCHRQANAGRLRSLLQVVRATIRTADRLGNDDPNTLLVCMPSTDLHKAQSKAEQMCRSLPAIGLGPDPEEGHCVTIGIAEADAKASFDSVVETAIALADSATSVGSAAIQIEKTLLPN